MRDLSQLERLIDRTMKGFTMKKFFCFAAPLVLAIGVLASGGTSVSAAGPPGSPPGQEPC